MEEEILPTNETELARDITEASSNQISGSEKDTKELETKENEGKKIEATEDVEVVKEEGSSEENKDSIVPIEVEKQNVDSVEVEDKPITMTDDSGEGSEQATEITLQEEEPTNSVDVNLENETEEVAQECEQIGDADEIKDPNENENQTYQTEDISEKSEQIPDALTESEKVVDFDPGETKESCETQEVETPALVTDISENNNQQEAQDIEAEMKSEDVHHSKCITMHLLRKNYQGITLQIGKEWVFYPGNNRGTWVSAKNWRKLV